MLIKELIAKLSEYPDHMEVIGSCDRHERPMEVNVYSHGYDSINYKWVDYPMNSQKCVVIETHN